MNILNDKNSIEYVIYILFALTLLVVFILVKTKKKDNIPNGNINIIPELVKKQVNLNDIKEGVDREFEKSDFNFSSLSLMIKGKQSILNPDLSKSLHMINIKDFFLAIQKNINLIVKTNVYDIDDKSLLSIKKAIWNMDFNKIVNTIHKVNIKLGYTEDVKDKALAVELFKKVIILALNNNYYNVLKNGDSVRFNEAILKFSKIQNKIKNNIPLNDEELDIKNKILMNKKIVDELVLISKGLKIDFLDFDSNKKELAIKINYVDIFSPKLEKIFNYYKNKNILAIKIYI